MMFQSTVSRIMAVSAVLALGACAVPQQQGQMPAPVVASNEGGNVYNPYTTGAVGGYTDPYAGANPYGAVPYQPTNTGAVAANNTVYQPQVSAVVTPPAANSGVNAAGQRVGNVNGHYVGNYAPVNIHATTHKVSAGDTVFNIAKRYGISQDNLRAWNNLPADNTISIGQVLRVKPAGSTQSAPKTRAPQTIAQPAGNYTPPAVSNANLLWTTPAYGTIVRSFGGGNKGIDISGSRGQPVVAAADGQVVYSGSGLRGYGNLIILQHNQTYLTAYGHNDSLMVREGQFVKRGQQIARMGSSDSSNGVKLHFEVRENGNPVNPTRFVRF